MQETELLSLIGLLGQMGQGALQGTDKAWVGNLGGVMAGGAKNIQAAMANKELADLLRSVDSHNVKGATYTQKPDGTTSWKLDSNAFDPQAYVQNIPQLLGQMNLGIQTQGKAPAPQAQASNQITPDMPVSKLNGRLGDMLAGTSPFVSSPTAPQAVGPSPLGMALISPEEQNAMLRVGMEGAKLPADIAESMSRAGVNWAQATKLGQALAEKPVTISTPQGPLTLGPDKAASYIMQSEGLRREDARVGIARDQQELDRQKLEILRSSTGTENSLRDAQVRAIDSKLEGLKNLAALSGDNAIDPKVLELLRLNPDAVSQVLRGMTQTADGLVRKARNPSEALTNLFTFLYGKALETEAMVETDAIMDAAMKLVEKAYPKEVIMQHIPGFKFSTGIATPEVNTDTNAYKAVPPKSRFGY